MERPCEGRTRQIFDYAEGVLPAEERAALEAHIGACPVCQKIRKEAETVSRLLEDCSEEPPQALFTGVMAGVRKEKAARSRRRILKFVPAAACLILIVGVLLLIPFLGSLKENQGSGRIPRSENLFEEPVLDKQSSSLQNNASELSPSCGVPAELSDEVSGKDVPNDREAEPLDWLSLFFDPSDVTENEQVSPDTCSTAPELSGESDRNVCRDDPNTVPVRFSSLWGYTICAYEDAPKSGAVAVMQKDGATLWLLPRSMSGSYRDITSLSESGEYLAVLVISD